MSNRAALKTTEHNSFGAALAVQITQTDRFQAVMLSKAKHLALAKNNRIMRA